MEALVRAGQTGHPGVEVLVKNDPAVMGILQQPS